MEDEIHVVRGGAPLKLDELVENDRVGSECGRPFVFVVFFKQNVVDGKVRETRKDRFALMPALPYVQSGCG